MKKIAVICKDGRDFKEWLREQNLFAKGAIFNASTLRHIGPSGESVYLAVYSHQRCNGVDFDSFRETTYCINNPEYGKILRTLKQRCERH